MILRRQILTIPDGNPVPDDTQVELRLHADNSLVATALTQNGWVEFQTTGGPGPHYIKTTVEGETHIASSKSTGISSTTDIPHFPVFLRTFTDGYIPDFLEEFMVSANGSGMQVRVGSGAGYYRGVLYDQPEAVTLPIEAAGVETRNDAIIIEVIPPGAGVDIEGRSRVKVRKNFGSISELVETDELWEHLIALVTVDPGVSAISSSAVITEILGSRLANRMRPVIADKSITKTMLSNTATPGVMVQRGSTVIMPHARMLNFVAQDFLPEAKKAGDYSEASSPYVDVYLNRPALLDWIASELDVGGGGEPSPSSGSTILWKDQNFNASGQWSGGFTTLPSGSVSLNIPPGKWLIETELNITLRGTGAGSQCTIRLTGNASPQGDDISQRIFPVGSNQYNSVTLTGRREVTHAGAVTYTVNAQRSHQSGPYVDFRDGVVRIKATKLA